MLENRSLVAKVMNVYEKQRMRQKSVVSIGHRGRVQLQISARGEVGGMARTQPSTPQRGKGGNKGENQGNGGMLIADPFPQGPEIQHPCTA